MRFEMFGASVLVGLMSGWLAGIAMKGGGYGQAACSWCSAFSTCSVRTAAENVVATQTRGPNPAGKGWSGGCDGTGRQATPRIGDMSAWIQRANPFGAGSYGVHDSGSRG